MGISPPALKFLEVEDKIEITQDDLLVNLIRNHTNQTSQRKTPKNILRFFILLANGSSIRQAAKQTGLNDRMVRKWKEQEWFHVVLKKVVEQLDEALDKKLTGVVHRGIDAVADRIDNGDYVLQKDGSLVRKPMNGRDAAITTAVMFDKRQLLRDKPTVIEQKSVDERLSDLGQRFAAFANATEIEVIPEVEVEQED